MKFSTSFSTLSLVALVASTFSLDGSVFASAKPQLRSKRVVSSETDHDSAATSDPSPRFDTILFAPSLHSPDRGVLVLDGLNEPLDEAETAFLQEALHEVLNMVRDDNGMEPLTQAVTVEQAAVTVEQAAVTAAADAAAEPSEDHQRRLRGRRNRPNKGKHIWSDHEMCEYQDGPKKGEIIPDCEFDIFLYRDHYCHNCLDDDWRDWITDFPSASPSEDPYAHFFDDFVNDDDDDDWTYHHWNNDDVPNMTDQPSSSPTGAPSMIPTGVPSATPTVAPTTKAPTKAPTMAPAPTKPPTKAPVGVIAEKAPKQPDGLWRDPDVEMCKMLARSRFKNLMNVPRCKFLLKNKNKNNNKYKNKKPWGN